METETKKPPNGTAYDGAVRLLGMREHSRFELEQKLQKRGFEPDAIAEALDRLVEQNYLNDHRFAEMISRQYSSLGRRGLVEQMKKRGVPQEIWLPVVEVISSDDEFERALDAARQKSSVPGTWEQQQKWRRRTAGFLMRRGFATSTVNRVLSTLTSESESEYGQGDDETV